tara:strand:- start:13068 stop:13202 length:135 start_codon:yes stop_codon:yes gene_type:complete
LDKNCGFIVGIGRKTKKVTALQALKLYLVDIPDLKGTFVKRIGI